MSGGSMNYSFYHFDNAADYVQSELANIKLKYKEGVYLEKDEYYSAKHPDKDFLKDGKTLTEAVMKRLEDALKCIRRASVYARRVEWFTSGDDGEASFCLRTDEDLAKVDKTNGIM